MDTITFRKLQQLGWKHHGPGEFRKIVDTTTNRRVVLALRPHGLLVMEHPTLAVIAEHNDFETARSHMDGFLAFPTVFYNLKAHWNQLLVDLENERGPLLNPCGTLVISEKASPTWF